MSGDGSSRERGIGEDVGEAGVPLGYSTQRGWDGFTITDQLEKKSCFRPRGRGQKDSGYRIRGYQGIQITASLQEGGSKRWHKGLCLPGGGAICLQNKLATARL